MKSETFDLGLDRCTVVFDGAMDQLERFADGRETLLITDENVLRLHGRRFPRVRELLTIPPGESTKTLEVASTLLRRLMELGLDRSCLIVGVGGGVVTDLAGFTASTYLRGVDFGFVATTLLAQVDAALGGKNGVNLDRYKNQVGVFRQPSFVINEGHALATLPPEELRSGLSEVVKSAAIGDRELFEFLELNAGPLLEGDREALAVAAESAARVKLSIVAQDPLEHGPRRLLNFGHTLGHALERCTEISHGAAVAVGMRAAVALSRSRGYLRAAEAERVCLLLERFGLPVRCPVDAEQVLSAVSKDKKRYGDSIKFVFLESLGVGRIEDIGLDELREAARDLR